MGSGQATIDEGATRAFLDTQIEARAEDGPVKEPPPPPPPEVVYVEVPGGYPYPRYSYRYPRTYYDPYAGHRLTLDNTLLGAGLGAIIGHQSGHRDRGAAIGAGFGLLLDLAEH
ncbi:MAG: hypothetical protein KDB80_09905 [Planctomycetes bacterium]|nr:hypothetical protein [Planctomycetota bacterium]